MKKDAVPLLEIPVWPASSIPHWQPLLKKKRYLKFRSRRTEMGTAVNPSSICKRLQEAGADTVDRPGCRARVSLPRIFCICEEYFDLINRKGAENCWETETCCSRTLASRCVCRVRCWTLRNADIFLLQSRSLGCPPFAIKPPWKALPRTPYTPGFLIPDPALHW